MTGFTLHQKYGVYYLTIDSFSRTGLVVHAFTTRRGGVSGGPYAGLNMSFRVGDRPENVLINRLSICRALGAEPADLVAAAQVHGDGVARVTAEHRGKGAAEAESALPATDALITNEPGVFLSSYHADCVPVFLLDPVQKAIGVVHAGWKGTALKIAARTVEAMQQSFGTRPRNCLAGIGPAIGPCCYEVDEPVFSRFQYAFADCWPALFTPVALGRWYLNLWEANRRALLEAGLQEERITAANLCTSCRQDLFFSHRASGGKTGRMAALLMLRP
ncbi:MAG: peptidoglycan editing factor PgeF [Bacillota bacterium]